MKRALLALAAATAAITFGAAPVGAQDLLAFGASPSAPSRFGGDRGDRHGGDRHHRGHHRSRADVVVPWDWSEGDWAYYNNRSWESDSFNDWWHDRPDRAFPRWLQNNQNCDRLWWSGGGWRC
jgi:hypothetical protein